MKFTLLNVAFSLLGSALLMAQEPSLPMEETPNTAAPEPSPTPFSLPTPLPQLIPPDVLPLSEPVASPALGGANVLTIPQLDQGIKASPVNTAAEASRRQIEWRELRNRVANDQDLKAKLKLADAAGTDLERRKLLRSYYEAYFGRIMALATTPEMKAYLNARKSETLAALPQPRVRPEAASAKRKS